MFSEQLANLHSCFGVYVTRCQAGFTEAGASPTAEYPLSSGDEGAANPPRPE